MGISIVDLKKKILADRDKKIEKVEVEPEVVIEESKVITDYEFMNVTDQKMVIPFNRRPKGIVAFRILKAQKLMWPNLFVKNEFSCLGKKSKYTTKTSNVTSLNPTWNEAFWLPVNSYDDTMLLSIKANSISRANVFFMTEMEEKLILKE